MSLPVLALRLFLFEDAVDDHGYGPVAGDVAGRAEAVHGYVEGYHQRLFLLAESQDHLQRGQGGHDAPTGNARTRHRHDGQHEDEVEEQGRVVGHAIEQTDGQGARRYLHAGARHVDGGAERNNKARYLLAHLVAQRVAEGHGYRGGRRARAQRREVGGQHVEQRADGIAPRHGPRDEVLVEKDEDVEHEYHHDDLGKHHDDAVGLAREGHVEEDAEDVQGKQRDDGHVDGLDDHLLEVGEHRLQRRQTAVGDGQSAREGEHQGRHHVEHGRDADGEEWLQVVARGRRHAQRRRHHRREEPRPRAVGQQPREDGVHVGDHHRRQEQPPRVAPDVANGRGDQSHNEQRNQEAQEVAEDGVECHEDAHPRSREHVAENHAQYDGDEDAR